MEGKLLAAESDNC